MCNGRVNTPAAPEPPPPDPAPGEGLFAARAARERTTHWLLGGVIVAVVVMSWPTEPRKLQRRATEFIEASNRADAKAAYAFIAPASRQKLSAEAWAAQQRAVWEVESVDVGADGQSGAVHLVGVPSKKKVTTRWVRVDGRWYYAPSAP